MSIRLRCPNVGLTEGVTATVVESAVDLLRPGDHVTFRADEGRTDLGTLNFDGNAYRVGNIRFLEDLSAERFVLVECELAD